MVEIFTGESPVRDVVIVGAGMCGLTLARELSKAGRGSWLLLDKGRSVGGRLATRRIDEQKFDHGAQFFTVRTPVFQEQVNAWLKANIIREWHRGFKRFSGVDDGTSHHAQGTDLSHQDSHPRYIGVGGMNQLAKSLASDLPPEQVVLNRKIKRLAVQGDFIEVYADSGALVRTKTLVMTAPIPQSLELIQSSGLPIDSSSVVDQLTKVVYEPCIALMGFFDAGQLPLDIFPLQNPNDVIAFLSDNHDKNLAVAPGALTVHLSAEASRGMFTAQDSVIADYVCHQLKLLFNLNKVSRPQSFEIQRWRYATPKRVLEQSYLEWPCQPSANLRIFFAGEVFKGPKIEGAFMSGYDLAQRIMIS